MQINYAIALSASLGLIAFILLALRTNAAVVFFSLCAGSLLATQLGGEASLISSTIIKNGEINHSLAYISLIVVPAILSAFFMRGSVNSAKFITNIAPTAAVAALMVLLVVPLLPESVRVPLSDTEVWDVLSRFQPIILIGGMVASIITLWINQPRKKSDKKKHH